MSWPWFLTAPLVWLIGVILLPTKRAKVKFIPIPSPISDTPRIANGWTFNPENKIMELYGSGTLLTTHFCHKKYNHDVEECRAIYGISLGVR